MFDTKKNLFVANAPKDVNTKSHQNAFLNAGMKKSAETLSANGALKYSKTSNDFVTEFGSCAKYLVPRKYDEAASTMSALWAEDPLLTVKMVIYLRAITRKVVDSSGIKTETVQRGQGLRHESIMRMMWLGVNHPEVFRANLPVFLSVGSWKDLFVMMRTDLTCNGWDNRALDWNFLLNAIQAGLSSEHTCDLVKKYMPTIAPKTKCRTPEKQANHVIGAWLANKLFNSSNKIAGYKSYRKLKTSGTAHQWQQAISRKDTVNWNTVSGRALAKLVNGKFLSNQGLEKSYEKWIEKQPVAKYTGYPFELFGQYVDSKGWSENLRAMKKYEEMTVNKQFMGLVKTAQENAKLETSLLVVRDTSGSMCGKGGLNFSANMVAKSLALFFSYMLPKGYFANSFMEFADNAKLHKWKGSTPVDRYRNDNCCAYGSTNFQSVIQFFCNLKRKGVDESEFPTGILCISDGEFNRAGCGLTTTNTKAALKSLRSAGFSDEYVDNFQIVLWDIPSSFGHGGKFETYEVDTPNMFQFSGYDPSVVSFLTGQEVKNGEVSTPKTQEELFQAAMSQEIMEQVSV